MENNTNLWFKIARRSTKKVLLYYSNLMKFTSTIPQVDNGYVIKLSNALNLKTRTFYLVIDEPSQQILVSNWLQMKFNLPVGNELCWFTKFPTYESDDKIWFHSIFMYISFHFSLFHSQFDLEENVNSLISLLNIFISLSFYLYLSPSFFLSIKPRRKR